MLWEGQCHTTLQHSFSRLHSSAFTLRIVCPEMSFALTYGSFGDIVETARIAKRIIDVLRSGRASHKRQKVISDLKGMHDDVATLSTLLDLDSSSPQIQHITDRLSAELTLCHSLMQQLFAKINPSNGVIGRILMALSEDTELISWRAEISKRRDALHLLLASLNSLLSREVGEHLGRVGSQVHYVGSGVHNVEAHVQNIGVEVHNFGVWGLAASHFLAHQVSIVGSQVQQVQQLIHMMSPRDISDPVFFVTDPLGRTITIQLSYCDGFNDLDRILKAHLHDRPQAGSRYVERGDYNVVSTEGIVIRPLDFAGTLRAGVQLEMSIIKRRRDRLKPTPKKCPHCNHTNSDARNNGWIHCSIITCGQRYQISSKERVAEIEEISSPQLSLQEDRTEFFRLVQIEAIYVIGELTCPWRFVPRLTCVHFSSNRRQVLSPLDSRTLHDSPRSHLQDSLSGPQKNSVHAQRPSATQQSFAARAPERSDNEELEQSETAALIIHFPRSIHT
ncbi:hypothetical protein C8R44DRAFT_758463 [Mycena epipterygia]|nr:hypothetical protein C8R44DRAFT_758463 [Mycena epipterygia]